jgi:Flp pilus assembly pilin Flp
MNPNLTSSDTKSRIILNPVRVKVCGPIRNRRLIRLAPSVNAPALQENSYRGISMTDLISKIWTDDQGQDIAEYAVMLAVILVIVVGTIRLIGSNANTVFSSAASSIQ